MFSLQFNEILFGKKVLLASNFYELQAAQSCVFNLFTFMALASLACVLNNLQRYSEFLSQTFNGDNNFGACFFFFSVFFVYTKPN